MKKIFTFLIMIVLTGSIYSQNTQAIDDTVYTDAASQVIVFVLDNDLYPDSSYTCMDYLHPYTPASGQLSYSGNYFWYQSDSGFVGIEKFQYMIYDCDSNYIIDSAWVVIIVGNGANGVILDGQTDYCTTNGVTLSVTPLSGIPPYLYLWNTGATTSFISGLNDGGYNVTVTDSLGNTGYFNFEIYNTFLNGSATITPPYDNGCTGIAAINISGGCPPYNYLWSNNATTISQSNLCSGYYYVTVTDQSINSIVITVSIPLFDANSMCITANPFCTGSTYNYPAGVNSGSGETGPNYGCLYSTPNPAWFYLRIDQPGDLILYMHSNPAVDIDFACWGPFTDPAGPCTSLLTAACTSCPNNTSSPTFYPSGNLFDCSYSTSWNETVHINNAQNGQWYIILITNYSNTPTSIIFDQTNIGQTGYGTADCNVFPIHIEGTVFNDENNNQYFNSGETGIENAIIDVQNEGLYFNSDSTGHYDAYMETGIHQIAPYINSPYVIITPNYYTISASSSGKDFAVYTTPGIEDLGINITNITAARPGFNVLYHLTYHNYGTVAATGSVQLISDTALNYLSSSPPADLVSGDTLIWYFSSLNPFNSDDISITYYLPDYIPMGDILENLASVTPVINDMTVYNNTDTLNQIVTNSYDPNLKEVLPVGDVTIDEINNQFNFVYTIHFQNEGTDTAFTVTVTDAISDLLFIPSIQILSSSHPCQLSLFGNNPVRFIFNNINLPSKSVNESASHGFIKFSIRPVETIAVGNIVDNNAGIIFDFNAPIITNTVSSFIKVIVVGIEQKLNESTLLSIIPNPNNGKMRIKFSNESNQVASVIINDITGRLMYSNNSFANDGFLDVSNFKAGIYFIKCCNGNEIITSKLIIKK